MVGQNSESITFGNSGGEELNGDIRFFLDLLDAEKKVSFLPKMQT